MKILCSDYDGTFNFKGVNDRKRAAVQRWRSAGNLFGFVSGRGLDTLLDIMAQDRVECDFAVANNGAVIAAADGSILSDVRCDGSYISDLVSEMFRLGCPWACFSASSRCTVYHDAYSGHRDSSAHSLKWAMEHLPYFTQVSTVLTSEAESARVAFALSQRFEAVVNPLQNGVCIDIVPAGVDKAEGIRRLARHLGVGVENVITVGDHVNDRAMIAAFHSYAVENAISEIKELADDVVVSVEELIEKEL